MIRIDARHQELLSALAARISLLTGEPVSMTRTLKLLIDWASADHTVKQLAEALDDWDHSDDSPCN